MWDLFISHASEDKERVARPLAERLAGTGLRVWFDEHTMGLGDSLRRKIDQGLARSRYGVVILSPHFFAKEWPQRELDGLVAREEDTEKVVLPVWHDVSRADVARYSPLLAGRLAVSTANGLDEVVRQILLVLSTEDTAGLPTLQEREAVPPARVPPAQERFRRVFYESFDAEHLTPEQMHEHFGSTWLLGRHQVWEGQVAGGVHTVTNTEGKEAALNNRLNYVESEEEPVDLWDCKVSVRVRVEPPSTAHSGAGLMFRAERDRPGYYGFFLNAGHNVSLARADGGRMRILWSQEIPAPVPGAFTMLRIAGRGPEFDLFVDGERLHTATDPDLRRGAPGIIAYSTGRFVFDDFALYLRVTDEPEMP